MKNKKLLYIALICGGLTFPACDFYDVNEDPNNITQARVSEILPSATVNIGYMGASDLMRYSNLIMQQFSGHGPVLNNTFTNYERYFITDSDVNNNWNNIYADILADLEQLIVISTEQESPHYTGVAKILKAYTYQVTVDAWGDVPYSEATKFGEVLYPEYDDDAAIYPKLLALLDEGIADINAESSVLEPTAYSTFYPNTSWEASRVQWERLANTLKLRLLIHYSEVDPGFASQQITALVNSGAQFMQSTDDNFEMMFLDQSQRQNPITSIEGGQFRNQFFPNEFIVDLMNEREDPRRASYFVSFPFNSGNYKGSTILDEAPSTKYSRLHSYIKGTPSAVNQAGVNPDGSIEGSAITYGGDAPSRLLLYSEYNFIRAEASLRFGAPGDAETFFKEGIRASMEDAGVPEAEAAAYIARYGTLTGSQEAKLEQIINQKYIANFGVMMENWTDWRRTGYPNIKPIPAPLAIYNEVPRSLFYPVSEVTSNPNIDQKESMLERVFWDVRQ
ncbi:SusD/RagB family nutrient-binding outer membrane lipoprotein [Pontibacter akesuensis]|uniref:Starch-binding associating with outer membrane n=1 Tax=Pontibacter akesuensis TaxID=388950 RepID=A0A1I7J2Z1_9BACT|nr:SusD/RagB family nutrient-binding outer membrane lipoprotein [Pontibacter akesuensis]SFU79451.1 Starch-binding associating with outer membrane [Pontibacter akesuensis]